MRPRFPGPPRTRCAAWKWVNLRENLCVCGPAGTGKSDFREALGHAAVEAGMTVDWFTIESPGNLVCGNQALSLYRNRGSGTRTLYLCYGHSVLCRRREPVLSLDTCIWSRHTLSRS